MIIDWIKYIPLHYIHDNNYKNNQHIVQLDAAYQYLFFNVVTQHLQYIPGFCHTMTLCYPFTREKWLKKKIGDIYDMSLFGDGIDGIVYKDTYKNPLESTKAANGHLATISYTLRPGAGGLAIQHVRSTKFIIGSSDNQIPIGIHKGILGMKQHEKRIFFFPPELTEYQQSIFCELTVLNMIDCNRYSSFQIQRMKQTRWDNFKVLFEDLYLFRVMYRLLFKRHYESKKEYHLRRQKEPLPANTFEDFFQD